jgi:hypothetical protein
MEDSVLWIDNNGTVCVHAIKSGGFTTRRIVDGLIRIETASAGRYGGLIETSRNPDTTVFRYVGNDKRVVFSFPMRIPDTSPLSFPRAYSMG